MTEEIRESGRQQTPAGRLGTPDDVAAVVAFLCSDEGGWINGQLIHADGGFSA
jgi:3-oxoacyl-[acyl-carrier protein] reductase